MSAVEPAPIEETGAKTSSSGSFRSSTYPSQPIRTQSLGQLVGGGSEAEAEQHVEADGACTSSSGSSHPSTSSAQEGGGSSTSGVSPSRKRSWTTASIESEQMAEPNQQPDLSIAGSTTNDMDHTADTVAQPTSALRVAVATPPVPTLAIQPAPAAVPPVVRVDPITRYHQFRPVDQLAFHMRHINIDMMAVELPHVSAIRDATPSTGSTSTSTSTSKARVPAAMQYTRPSFKRVETVAEVENNVQRTNDEMDGSNWQHAVLNTTSSRTTTVTTYKRDRERADFQRESHVSNLSNMRSTGAHEPDLSLEASTATTGWSIRSTSRVAIQALQPHTPLLKKSLNAEEEEELTVARVTESHQDTRALQCNAASLGQDIFGRCSPQQVQSMAELQPPQVRQRKIVRKIFNTSVWNGQDDPGVDELTSILRCDEKPSMQQLERVRRCCSKTCVHQNRSAKIFKIGSKTPTSRGNGARQSACSKDDASALSDVSKEQHSDGKCIFEKVSVGIVAKRDDSVIGDEDGAALSGHRQEDPSNRFLLSVGPSHASDATVYMEHAISTATLAEKTDVQRPHPNATMLQTRMPNPNDVYTLRSSRADRYPVPMDAMNDSDVRHASNKRSQSVADKLSDKNDALLVHFGATRLVDCASTRNEGMSVVQRRGWCANLAESRL